MSKSVSLESTFGVISISSFDSEAPDNVWNETTGVAYVRGSIQVEVPSNRLVKIAVNDRPALSSKRCPVLIQALISLTSGELIISSDFNKELINDLPRNASIEVRGDANIAKRNKLYVTLIERSFRSEEEEFLRSRLKEGWPKEKATEWTDLNQPADAVPIGLSPGDILKLSAKNKNGVKENIAASVLFSEGGLALIGVFKEKLDSFDPLNAAPVFYFIDRIYGYPKSHRDSKVRNPAVIGHNSLIESFSKEHAREFRAIAGAAKGLFDFSHPGIIWAAEVEGFVNINPKEIYFADFRTPVLTMISKAQKLGLSDVVGSI